MFQHRKSKSTQEKRRSSSFSEGHKDFQKKKSILNLSPKKSRRSKTPPPCFRQEMIKMGDVYLLKQKSFLSGSFASKWNKATLVLKSESVEFFDSQFNKKGELFFCDDLQVVNSSNRLHGKFSFQITSKKGKLFEFATDSQQQKDDWIQTISKRISQYSDIEQEEKPKIFSKFLNVLCGADPSVASALCVTVPRSEMEYVAPSLVRLLKNENTLPQVIQHVASKEISETTDVSTLFRTNSMCSFLVGSYWREIDRNFLTTVLKPALDEVISTDLPFELDPVKAGEDVDFETNAKNLRYLSEQVLNRILTLSLEGENATLQRNTCSIIANEIKQKFPEHTYLSVTGFLFLRYIVPTIVTPQAYNLIESEKITAVVRRKLILISKCIQSLANGVQEWKKETWMKAMNPFIQDNFQRLKDFCNDFLVELPEQQISEPSKKDPQNFHFQYKDIKRIKTQIETNLSSIQEELTPEKETLFGQLLESIDIAGSSP